MKEDIDLWVKENYTSLLEITKNLKGVEDYDVLHYALEEFLKKKNVLDIIQSGGGRFYIINILLRALRSETNPYYKAENRNHLPITTEPQYEEYEGEFFKGLTDSIVMEKLENVFWYDKEVFLLYMTGGYTYKTLSDETGISRTSLNYTVNKVKDYLKEKIKDEINRRH